MNATGHVDTLPEGYVLHWYEIGGVLGRGGFGITYLANDTNLAHSVAIKEYLPAEYAARQPGNTVAPTGGDKAEVYRWGLERFLNEARTLAQFRHPNIVRVVSVFEQNNTAYMVMEYERGVDLAQYLKKKGRINDDELLAIFMPVLDGLALVHEAGFIHRDIKPANIYIREDGTPILLDFGSARLALGDHTRTLTSLVTGGYAPFEQYHTEGGSQGPWTDIYSMGATLYRVIAGNPPVDALTRGSARLNGKPDPLEPLSVIAAGAHPEHLLLAIDHALMFREADRPQSVREWMRMLDGSAPAPPLPADEFAPPRAVSPDAPTVLNPPAATGHAQRGSAVTRAEPGRETSRRRRPLLLAAAGGGLMVALAAVLAWRLLPIEPGAPQVAEQRAPAVVDPAAAERAAAVEALLAGAARAEAESRLVDPPGDNALEAYREVLRLQPANAEADRGIARLLHHFVALAEEQIGADQLDQAGTSLDIAEGIRRDALEVRQARVKLSERRVALQRIELERLTAAQREAARIAAERREAEQLARAQASLTSARSAAGVAEAARASAAAARAAELAAGDYEPAVQALDAAQAQLAEGERLIAAGRAEDAEAVLNDALTLLPRAESAFRTARERAAEAVRSRAEQARTAAQAQLEQLRELMADVERAQTAAAAAQTPSRAAAEHRAAIDLQQEALVRAAEGERLLADGDAGAAGAAFADASRLLDGAREGFEAAAAVARARQLAERRAAVEERRQSVAASRGAADAVEAQHWSRAAYERARQLDSRAEASIAAGEALAQSGEPGAAVARYEEAEEALREAAGEYARARSLALDRIAEEQAREARLDKIERRRAALNEAQTRLARARVAAEAVGARTRADSGYDGARELEDQAMARIIEASELIDQGAYADAERAFEQAMSLLDQAADGMDGARKLSVERLAAEQQRRQERVAVERRRAAVDAARTGVTRSRLAAEAADAPALAPQEFGAARASESSALEQVMAAAEAVGAEQFAAAEQALREGLRLFEEALAAFDRARALALERHIDEQKRAQSRAEIERQRVALHEARQALVDARVAAETAEAPRLAGAAFASAVARESEADAMSANAGALADAGDLTAAAPAFVEALAALEQARENYASAAQLASDQAKAERRTREARLAELEARRAAVATLLAETASARAQAEASQAERLAPEKFQAALTEEDKAARQLAAAEQLLASGELIEAEQLLSAVPAALRSATQGFRGAGKSGAERLREQRLAGIDAERARAAGARERLARARAAAESGEAPRLAASAYRAARDLESAAAQRVGLAERLTGADDLVQARAAWEEAVTALDGAARGYDAARQRATARRSLEAEAESRILALLEAAGEAETRVARSRAGAETLDAPLRAAGEYETAVSAHADATRRARSARQMLGERRLGQAEQAANEALTLLEAAEDRFARARERAQRAADQEAATPARPDIEVVVERIGAFRRALQARDLHALEQVSAFSAQRRAFVDTLFRQYREIEVSVSDITLLAAKGSASAVVTIERLVDQNGSRVIPAPSWREARIELHKSGSQWGKVDW